VHGRVCRVLVAAKRYAALRVRDLPMDDEAHPHYSCAATAVIRQERRFA
jgi:hypothetical protein